jgi:hypothetical protein
LGAIVGRIPSQEEAPISREWAIAAISAALESSGPEGTLAMLDELWALGFDVARLSGASIHPFAQAPEGSLPGALKGCGRALERVADVLAASTAFDDPLLGPQLLSARADGPQRITPLVQLVAGHPGIVDANGETVPIGHGFVEGLTRDEQLAMVAESRRNLAGVVAQWPSLGRELRQRKQNRSFHLLARAMRTPHPGIVFARAAASGETDPLIDLDSRLFLGLPIE